MPGKLCEKIVVFIDLKRCVKVQMKNVNRHVVIEEA